MRTRKTNISAPYGAHKAKGQAMTKGDWRREILAATSTKELVETVNKYLDGIGEYHDAYWETWSETAERLDDHVMRLAVHQWRAITMFGHLRTQGAGDDV